ncbi:MAG: FAD-dependent pyridine nucleotide-disulfide oxidoreductase [Gammaproteobacteria bacterium]|jgi:NADH dehydrogenase|nr:FAD-dependent pyridine nucleotide-disulfide oxidoreductase [Gammaproteobacteria bacterium]
MQEISLQGQGRPRIVIVGCGFGGLFAARALRRAPADVLVIDHNNFHLFQPLLYQVASAALAPADIALPIRTILRHQPNAAVMLGEVEQVNLAAQYVHAGDSRVPYDYLILAPGAVDNYFGHSEWHGFAPGMKEVEDATLIRSRMLLSFETAEIESDPTERAAHLAFIIVGGGPTGVELAGAIKELAVDVIARDFRVADTRRARVILVEAGPRLLPALHADSSERALKQLHDLGVEVLLGKPVTAIFEDGVEVGGERIRSYNVIWAAGVRASPLVSTLDAELGPGGRVKVAPDCSIPGYPNAFVIGDAAYLVDSATGQPVPGVSQGALQMGKYAARVIEEELVGNRASATRAHGFHYKDLGSMATVGKSRAVVEIGRLHFGGLLAWFAWMALHITVLIGFRNRIAVLTSWIYSYVFFRRGSRLITGLAPTKVKQPIAPATSTSQPPSP